MAKRYLLNVYVNNISIIFCVVKKKNIILWGMMIRNDEQAANA